MSKIVPIHLVVVQIFHWIIKTLLLPLDKSQGTINVCRKCQGHPSNSFWDISVWRWWTTLLVWLKSKPPTMWTVNCYLSFFFYRCCLVLPYNHWLWEFLLSLLFYLVFLLSFLNFCFTKWKILPISYWNYQVFKCKRTEGPRSLGSVSGPRATDLACLDAVCLIPHLWDSRRHGDLLGTDFKRCMWQG